jgi:Na+/melibiose symporter-like transporter
MNSAPDTASPAKPVVYRAGTLTYTRLGLVALFTWLLWGVFCDTMTNTVIPSILPLRLRALDAPNWLIGVLITSLAGVLNMTVCPWISFKSDRYRSRFGRRIPFIMYSAPFLAFSLVLIGYSDPLARFIHSMFFQGSSWSVASVTILLIAVFAIGFDFFNMFVGSVYWYLFNDVVPEKFLARFVSMVQMVGMAGGALYSFFIFRYAESHFSLIFLAAALMYLVGFSIICFKVKEGNYPPPPPNIDGRRGFVSSFKTYAQECYSVRFYWGMFLAGMFSAIGGAISMFQVFSAKSLGFSLGMIGNLNGVISLVAFVMIYFAGLLADKFHPLRTLIISRILIVCVVTPINFMWLFVDFSPQAAFHISMVLALVCLPLYTVADTSEIPLSMKLLPRDRYGQFSSANSLIRSLGRIIGGAVAGLFIDAMCWFDKTPFAQHLFVHPANAEQNALFYYRYLVFWMLFFQILTVACWIWLYRQWKRHGGDESYVPPVKNLP